VPLSVAVGVGDVEVAVLVGVGVAGVMVLVGVAVGVGVDVKLTGVGIWVLVGVGVGGSSPAWKRISPQPLVPIQTSPSGPTAITSMSTLTSGELAGDQLTHPAPARVSLIPPAAIGHRSGDLAQHRGYFQSSHHATTGLHEA